MHPTTALLLCLALCVAMPIDIQAAPALAVPDGSIMPCPSHWPPGFGPGPVCIPTQDYEKSGAR